MNSQYRSVFWARPEFLIPELRAGNLYKLMEDKSMVQITSSKELYNCVMRENVHKIIPNENKIKPQISQEDQQLKDIFLWCNKNGIVHDPVDMKKMQDAGLFYELNKERSNG